MSAAERLLNRLERVRPRGAGVWSASCPGPVHANGDRSVGLGVKQVDDRVLVNCPAGCSALEIVDAVGLTLSDLFDRPLGHSVSPVRSPPFPLEMARRIRHCALILGLAAGDLKYGKSLSEADEKTLLAAFHVLDDLVATAETWPRSAVRS